VRPGTVEPEELIDVGAQVAGQINSFGKDKNGKTIDYGSVVEEGTILAQIDDSLYAADVAMAKAQLQQAMAGVQRAEADLGQLKAKLYQASVTGSGPRGWGHLKLWPSQAMIHISRAMKPHRPMSRSEMLQLFRPKTLLPMLRQPCSGHSET